MPADVAHTVLEISPDGVSASIAKFACHAYILLTCLAFRALDYSINWLQASFAAQ